MDTPRIDLEFLDYMEGQSEEQAIGPKGGESFQASGNSVIVEASFLDLREPQNIGVDRSNPFGDSIKGRWRQKDVS